MSQESGWWFVDALVNYAAMKVFISWSGALIALVALIATGCRTHDDSPSPVKKASVAMPADAKAVSGSYYRGDRLSYNLHLNLNSDGSYDAECKGCLGTYGDARGTWRLDDSRITFSPSRETGMMEGRLRQLDILPFNSGWVLLPTDKEDRKFYDKWGVLEFTCFQNKDRLK